VERLDEVDDMSDINKAYELSEIGLTDKQKQQIMNEKSVTITREGKSATMTNELKYMNGQTVALTTDSGSYIADVENIYINMSLMEMMMISVSCTLLSSIFVKYLYF
jgi:hypothetical protein